MITDFNNIQSNNQSNNQIDSLSNNNTSNLNPINFSIDQDQDILHEDIENCENFIFLNDNEISSYNPKKRSPNKTKYRNIYCVNCGEKGHVVKDCNGPITSFGIIAFKVVEYECDEIHDKNNRLLEILSSVNQESSNIYPKTKFLMIQRKDTMGFTDYVRGKYPDDPGEFDKVLPIFLN